MEKIQQIKKEVAAVMGRELFMACCDNDLARVATLLASEYEENPGKRKNIDVNFRMESLPFRESRLGLILWAVTVLSVHPLAISMKTEIEFYDAEIYIVFFFWHADYNVFIPWRTI